MPMVAVLIQDFGSKVSSMIFSIKVLRGRPQMMGFVGRTMGFVGDHVLGSLPRDHVLGTLPGFSTSSLSSLGGPRQMKGFVGGDHVLGSLPRIPMSLGLLGGPRQMKGFVGGDHVLGSLPRISMSLGLLGDHVLGSLPRGGFVGGIVLSAMGTNT